MTSVASTDREELAKELRENAFNIVFGKNSGFGEIASHLQDTVEQVRKDLTGEVFSLLIAWNLGSEEKQKELETAILRQLCTSSGNDSFILLCFMPFCFG